MQSKLFNYIRPYFDNTTQGGGSTWQDFDYLDNSKYDLIAPF